MTEPSDWDKRDHEQYHSTHEDQSIRDRQELTIALGELSVAFGELDASLQATVWGRLGVEHEIGAIVTTKLSFQNLVRVCEQLFAADDNPEFEPLRGRLESVGQRRDTLIHSMWDWVGDASADDDHPAGTYRLRWTRAGRLQVESQSMEEIRVLVNQIWTLNMELEQI